MRSRWMHLFGVHQTGTRLKWTVSTRTNELFSIPHLFTRLWKAKIKSNCGNPIDFDWTWTISPEQSHGEHSHLNHLMTWFHLTRSTPSDQRITPRIRWIPFVKQLFRLSIRFVMKCQWELFSSVLFQSPAVGSSVNLLKQRIWNFLFWMCQAAGRSPMNTGWALDELRRRSVANRIKCHPTLWLSIDLWRSLLTENN